MRRGCAIALALLVAPCALVAGAQSVPAQGLAGILGRVGRSVERYYERAQSVVCTETVSLQTLGYDLLGDGSPLRRLVFELRVAWDSSARGSVPDARVERQLTSVNGRAPRPNDKPKCTDPTSLTPDNLQMLLPVKQAEYVFTMAGDARVNGRRAVMLDYRSRYVGPVETSVPEDKEECFVLSMPGRTRGRVWIDIETDDVLRMDEWLPSFVDARVPRTKKVKDPLDVTVERLDSTTVYRPVTFSDPAETLMLPASTDSLTVIRNSGSPRLRVAQRFTHYRRFTTGGRVVDDQ